jgi:steroid 5-alpha reductase family enzyme
MNAWLTFALGAAMMALLFVVAWAWARKCDNYSLVDAVWAFGIGLTGGLWLVISGVNCLKHWLAGALLVMWSMRLGWHLQRRIRRAHPEEDARYSKLRDVWTGRVASAFFWFFQAQGISVILLALPFLLIARDPDTAWSAWESAGLAVTLMGILGEGLADSQMSAFKSVNSDSKAVCQAGLWRYSRHPNYFFEAIIWVGFYCYACGSEWGWAMVYAPAVIIYLLLRVTGIPPTEAAAVLRKGDAYRLYQKTTSAFIPWPPRRIE